MDFETNHPVVRITEILKSDVHLIENWAALKDRLLLQNPGDFLPTEIQFRNGTITTYDLFRKMMTTWISSEGSQATINNLRQILHELGYKSVTDKIKIEFGDEKQPKNSLPLPSHEEPENRSLIRGVEFSIRSGLANVFDFWSESKSGVSGGGNLQKHMFFTDDADKPDRHTATISHNELLGYFPSVKGIKDRISHVWIYKQSLNYFTPQWWGAWHEFIVVESKCNKNISRYWAFEKNSEGIWVQRADSFEAAKTKNLGVDRIRVTDEGRKSQNGVRGETVLDIFQYIHKEGYLKDRYDALNGAYRVWQFYLVVLGATVRLRICL